MTLNIPTMVLESAISMTGRFTRDGTPIGRSLSTIKTIMSSVHQHHKRVTGDRGNNLGDMTWITLDSLRAPSQLPDVRPVLGPPHPSATGKRRTPLSESSQRRLAENLRQALVSASVYVRNTVQDDTEKQRLLAAYDRAYRDLGEFSDDQYCATKTDR